MNDRGNDPNNGSFGDFGGQQGNSYGQQQGNPYGQQQGNPYGQQAGNGQAYGAPGGFNQANFSAQPGEATTYVRGTGKVEAFASLKWGFKMVIRNWQVWILLALALSLLSSVVSFVALPDVSDFRDPAAISDINNATVTANLVQGVVLLVYLFVSPLLFSLGVAQLKRDRITWSDISSELRYGPVLLTVFLVGLISVTIVLVVSMIVGFVLFFSIAAIEASGRGALSAVAIVIILISILIATIVVLAAVIFFYFVPWYSADGADTGTAFSQGIKAVRRNFFPIFGMLLVVSLLVGIVVGILAGLLGGLLALALGGFGLALSIVVAVLPSMIVSMSVFLASGRMYRQASGGSVPVIAG